MRSYSRAWRGLWQRIARPIPVADGAYQIRTILGARVTVILDRGGILLIDSGTRGSLRLIKDGLAALGAGLRDIDLVVLTHYHPDHGGGLGALANACEGKVAIHRLEADCVRGESLPPSPFRSPLLQRAARPFLPALYSGAARVDLILEDGDALPYGREVRIIHTPGHTPGSVCLYLPDKRLLVAGDALQYRFRRLSPPAAAVTLDPPLARESLGKLLDLDIDCVIFSHFSPLRGDVHGQISHSISRHASGA